MEVALRITAQNCNPEIRGEESGLSRLFLDFF